MFTWQPINCFTNESNKVNPFVNKLQLLHELIIHLSVLFGLCIGTQGPAQGHPHLEEASMSSQQQVF